MSNTKCKPNECRKNQYCDPGLYACTPCSRVCRSKLKEDENICKSKCKGFDLTKYIDGQPVKQTKTQQSSRVTVASTLRPQHDQQVSNSSKAAVGSSLYITIIVIAVIVVLAILILGFVAYKFLKSRKKNNRNSLQHVPERSDQKESTTKPDENIPLNLYPASPEETVQTVNIDQDELHERAKSDNDINTDTDSNVRTLSLANSNADVEKGVPSLYGNNLAEGNAGNNAPSVIESGGDSRLGAVGGVNLPLQQDIAPVPMANMYDNDSGCGSVRNNGTRPSEEFEQMNRLIYQERGINMDRLGQPLANAPEQPNNNDAQPNNNGQPRGRRFESLFPGVVPPSKQKNRPIYDELKRIDWVMGYHSAGQSIEVYVNLGSLDATTVEQQLADLTGAPVTKFHVKQNEDTDFFNYSHKILIGISFPIHLAPFEKKQVMKYQAQAWKELGLNLQVKCVVGAFISVEGTNKTYCITVSHALKLGGVCYLQVNDDFHLVGKCVSITNTVGFDKALCERDSSLRSSHLKDCECCMDLAIVEILNKDFCVFNNFGGEKLQEETSYELEMYDWRKEFLADDGFDSLNNLPIQMKNRNGDIKKGFIIHPSCEFTDKSKDLHMHSQITVQSNEDTFLSEGDCGSLLTSLPNVKTGKVQVFGMFYGVFKKNSGEEHAVAFPLSSALALASRKDYKGKKLSLLKTPVHAQTHTQIDLYQKCKVQKCEQDTLHLDSGVSV